MVKSREGRLRGRTVETDVLRVACEPSIADHNASCEMDAIPLRDVAVYAGASEEKHADGPRQSNAFFRPLAVCATSAGELYVADSGNHRIRFINKYGYVTTHAGDGRRGMKNGVKEMAQFDRPSGICRSSQGHLLISDSGNHLVRIVTTQGQVKTYAGTGEIGDKDGPAMEASFNAPMDLCIDFQGQLYVCDSANHRIRMITSARIVNTVTGSSQGYMDGAKDEAKFNHPCSARLTPTRLGTLLIADTGNHCIRLLNNGYVTTFAGRCESGFHVAGGKRSDALFHSPISLTVSSDESVYVSDAGNHCIYHIASNGNVSVLSGGTPGCQDGSKEQAAFKRPGGTCLVGQRQLILAETGHGRILVVKPDGSVANFAGRSRSGTIDGAVNKSTFFKPQALFSASSNDLLVADTMSNKIRRIRNGNVTTFAGSPERGCGNGRKDLANFDSPTGICISPANIVYISDSNNHVIRNITDGNVFTFAGTIGQCGFADGPGSVAKFHSPVGLILIPSALLVADSLNHRIRIITKDASVSTFAGCGSPGFLDGPCSSASFNMPTELAYSSSDGSIYISDHLNHAIRIIKVAEGTVRTLVGNGHSGMVDGPRHKALLHSPRGLSLTPDGGLLVADTGNRSVRLINRSDGHTMTFIESDRSPIILSGDSPARSPVKRKTSPLNSTTSSSNSIKSSTSASSVAADSKMEISENSSEVSKNSSEVSKNSASIEGEQSSKVLGSSLGSPIQNGVGGPTAMQESADEGASSSGEEDEMEDEEDEPEQVPIALSLTNSGVLFIADSLRNQILYLPCPRWDLTRQSPKAKDFVQFYSFAELGNSPQETCDFQLVHNASGAVFPLHRFFVYARCPTLLQNSDVINVVQSIASADSISNFVRLLYSDHFTPITTIEQVLSACQLAYICTVVSKPAWVSLVKYHISDFLYEQLANVKRRLKNGFHAPSGTHSQANTTSMQAPDAPIFSSPPAPLSAPSTPIDYITELQNVVNDCIDILLHVQTHCGGAQTSSPCDPAHLFDLILGHIKSFSKSPTSQTSRSRSSSISTPSAENGTSTSESPSSSPAPAMISFKLPKHHSGSSSSSSSVSGSSSNAGGSNHGRHSFSGRTEQPGDFSSPMSSPRSSSHTTSTDGSGNYSSNGGFTPDFSRLSSSNPEFHNFIIDKYSHANGSQHSHSSDSGSSASVASSPRLGYHSSHSSMPSTSSQSFTMEHTLSSDMSTLYEKCLAATLIANVNGTSAGRSTSSTKEIGAPDFSILIGNSRFFCHKMILYARWSHFADLIKSGRLRASDTELVLQSPLTPELVSALLRYLYTNDVSHFPSDVNGGDEFCRGMLKCALLYDFVSPGDLSNQPVRGFELLMSHCRHALMTPLTVHNCAHLLNTLYEFGSVTQQNRVVSYIARNLKQVMESPDDAAVLASVPAQLHSKILFSHFSMLQVLEEQ